VVQSGRHEALRVILYNDQALVRPALKQVVEWLARCGLSDDLQGSAEIALAEVLNNIVEHGYGSETSCAIEMHCDAKGEGVSFVLIDSGVALPEEALASESMPEVNTPREALPEGGFGMPLLHMLADDVSYMRTAGENRLAFRMRDTA